MSKDREIPHIIFHGTNGSGKKTMINIFLRMIYGDNIDDLKTAVYNIMGSGNKLRKETFLHSDNHIIINPSGTPAPIHPSASALHYSAGAYAGRCSS
jgi:DNA polymerase III delta prime subunit